MATENAPRRRAPRVVADLTARLLGRTAREVTVMDLSTTGCLVRSPATLGMGSIFDLELPLGERTLRVKVQVADCAMEGTAPAESPRYLAGLQFVGLTAPAEADLRRFVEARRRANPRPR